MHRILNTSEVQLIFSARLHIKYVQFTTLTILTLFKYCTNEAYKCM